MRLPEPRGPLSRALLDRLRAAPGDVGDPVRTASIHAGDSAPARQDEDLQLSLSVCYELHYRGLPDVAAEWEWEPSLVAVAATLERRYLADLRALAPAPPIHDPADVPAALRRLGEAEDGPSLARFLQREATVDQFREFVVHRSAYHLKEADPHSWAIPRLSGRQKSALVEIQADEYGAGRPGRMHAELFAMTMRALGLDASYGAYLDVVPAVTLATVNAASLFGLHRRWRGALVGHLAVLEMTSSLPNRTYGNGLRRLGFGADATWFYDEHVEADAAHEHIAVTDLCGSLAADEPELASDILFGGACCLALDNLFAATLLDAWAAGRSSLRPGPPGDQLTAPGSPEPTVRSGRSGPVAGARKPVLR
jgi:hypothetical protein